MIGRLLLAAPIFYIGVCYLYLYLVHFGFGGQSVTFAAATDIFSVSFGRVAPFYFLMFGAYIYGHLHQVDDPLRVRGREEFDLHPTLRGPVASFPMRAFPWLMLVAFLTAYFFTNQVVPAFLLVAGIPLYAKASRLFAEKNDIDLRLTQVSATLLVFTALLLMSGFSYGFFLRYAPIDELSGDYPMCGSNIVLMPVGDRFIVALPNGRRAIASEDCEIQFEFQRRRATTWVI